MQRERISENVYWFQSEVYAQVTAGAITGPQWAVMIDTLAMPDETLAMRSYIEEELSVPVRYIINTHYHADHSWGNSFFPGATVVGHALCRKLMLEKGPAALETARKQNAAFKPTKIVAPHLTFGEGMLSLRVGKKSLQLLPTPGHSADGISVLVEEDRVLFAGDAFMPLPYVVDGSLDQLVETTKQFGKMGLENIIQGHGDIILRGEIDQAVKDNLTYLNNLRKMVKAAAKKREPLEALAEIDIESCGKSRVALGGLADELHKRNVRFIYRQILAGQPPASAETAAAEPAVEEEEPIEEETIEEAEPIDTEFDPVDPAAFDEEEFI